MSKNTTVRKRIDRLLEQLIDLDYRSNTGIDTAKKLIENAFANEHTISVSQYKAQIQQNIIKNGTLSDLFHFSHATNTDGIVDYN